MELLNLIDENQFGWYYGSITHIQEDSRILVNRLLVEFNLSQGHIYRILHPIICQDFARYTSYTPLIESAFGDHNWQYSPHPHYPNSNYSSDASYHLDDNRKIFLEIEMSDPSRISKILIMERTFRDCYMRLGIYIFPESISDSAINRFNYIQPNFPLWVIGVRHQINIV